VSDTAKLKSFREIVSLLEAKFPEVGCDIYEDDEAPDGYAIGLLSTGPDHAPPIEDFLPDDWRFSGWKNPDQRNNMGTVKKLLK
jgi:hypothetical protein